MTEDIAAKIRCLAEEGVFTLPKGNVEINIDAGRFQTLKVERITHPKKFSTEAPKVLVDLLQVSPIVH